MNSSRICPAINGTRLSAAARPNPGRPGSGRSSSADSDGSGLGLSIVKAIAERCGCSLQFIAHADGLEVCLAARLRNEGG